MMSVYLKEGRVISEDDGWMHRYNGHNLSKLQEIIEED